MKKLWYDFYKPTFCTDRSKWDKFLVIAKETGDSGSQILNRAMDQYIYDYENREIGIGEKKTS